MTVHSLSPLTTDTIAAQATPPGRGGIAVLRVSGPLVQFIMQSLFGRALSPRQASLLPFTDESQEPVDEGIAIYFPMPHSFTGEDVLELQCHGGPVVVDLLLTRLLQLGARIARPGEFSERAFLNGKLDLVQAEAIADLIDASSKQAARQALRSLQGDFSKAIQHIQEQLTTIRLYVEAAIDFSEEEIDLLSQAHLLNRVQALLQSIATLQQQAKQGSLLREGVTVVIAGEPNVGKSSLLNRLSGEEIAIVTDIPGTTRDVLRQMILIDGMPMHMIDTAGLRHSEDVVEQEGIRRAHQEMRRADMILYVYSADRHWDELALAARKSILLDTLQAQSQDEKNQHHDFSTLPFIFICNKIDLLSESPTITTCLGHPLVKLSVKQDAGIELLKQTIKAQVGFYTQTEGLYLARRRHLTALKAAYDHCDSAFNQLSTRGALELAAEDLRLAQQALGEITGELTADDLLGKIFASFCIGK